MSMVDTNELRELLPCPFCGSEGKRYDYEDHGGRFTVYNVLCGNDECPASELVVSSVECQDVADAMWNRRAPINTAEIYSKAIGEQLSEPDLVGGSEGPQT